MCYLTNCKETQIWRCSKILNWMSKSRHYFIEVKNNISKAAHFYWNNNYSLKLDECQVSSQMQYNNKQGMLILSLVIYLKFLFMSMFIKKINKFKELIHTHTHTYILLQLNEVYKAKVFFFSIYKSGWCSLFGLFTSGLSSESNVETQQLHSHSKGSFSRKKRNSGNSSSLHGFYIHCLLYRTHVTEPCSTMCLWYALC